MRMWMNHLLIMSQWISWLKCIFPYGYNFYKTSIRCPLKLWMYILWTSNGMFVLCGVVSPYVHWYYTLSILWFKSVVQFCVCVVLWLFNLENKVQVKCQVTVLKCILYCQIICEYMDYIHNYCPREINCLVQLPLLVREKNFTTFLTLCKNFPINVFRLYTPANKLICFWRLNPISLGWTIAKKRPTMTKPDVKITWK
jgi:hypothetical protein